MAKDKGWQTELSRMIVLKDGAALTTPNGALARSSRPSRRGGISRALSDGDP
jgi:hypothetical protein